MERAVDRNPRSLFRVLGLAFGVAVIIGGMVGGGILRTPGAVAAQLPDVRLIYLVWVLGGLYVLVAVNTYAELATALPKSGGGYVYLQYTYGDFVGFASGWTDLIISALGIAYLAITSGEYLGQLFPSLAGRENILAPAMILLFGLVHSVGIRTSSALQQLTSLAKVLLLIALVGAVFYFPTTAAAAPLHTSGHVSLLAGFGAIIVAAQMVMETYAGFASVVYFSEETTNPGRTIPLSMFVGAITVMVLYLLINAALLHGLTIAQLGASKLPVADLAAVYYGPVARTAVTVIAVVSLLGIINTIVLYSARTPYAMSRDRLLPQLGGYVSKGGVPLVAMWFIIAVSIVFSSLGSFETLLAIAAFLGLTGDTLVYAALFVLRRREPGLQRPFRAFGYPFLPAVLVLISFALLVGYLVGNPWPSAISVLLLLTTYPAFRLLARRLKTELAMPV